MWCHNGGLQTCKIQILLLSCFAVTTVRWCTPPSQLTFLPWAKAPSKPVGASRLRPKTSPYSSLDHTLVNTQYIYLC
ncbi:hypothetical protein BD769DRAFT_1416887 [Suillus cothurnatus]|nr:hypothetical protein BD769DRAFT_1416887 [Suillus cothurnatus]